MVFLYFCTMDHEKVLSLERPYIVWNIANYSFTHSIKGRSLECDILVHFSDDEHSSTASAVRIHNRLTKYVTDETEACIMLCIMQQKTSISLCEKRSMPVPCYSVQVEIQFNSWISVCVQPPNLVKTWAVCVYCTHAFCLFKCEDR